MATETERTDIELLKQEQSYMNKKIDNIEDLLKEFIKSANDKFATKSEHRINKEAIDKINKVFFWFGTVVWWSILVAILNLVIAQWTI